MELIYALPDAQHRIELNLPAGATAAAALQHWPADYPSVPTGARVGIWGKVVSADHTLRAGDRLEIYRPLLMTPMEARRRRAARKATK